MDVGRVRATAVMQLAKCPSPLFPPPPSIQLGSWAAGWHRRSGSVAAVVVVVVARVVLPPETAPVPVPRQQSGFETEHTHTTSISVGWPVSVSCARGCEGREG